MRWRQIGAFRPLMNDRRMLWLVSIGRAAVFLSYIEAGPPFKSRVLSEFRKVFAIIFLNFTIFGL